MMQWDVKYIREAEKDFSRLDNAQKKLVLKAIQKVSQNPVSVSEGGYGKPLGHKYGNNLTGLMKIKLRGAGLRIVYRTEIGEDNVMRIIVISVRSDNEVYETANKRIRSGN